MFASQICQVWGERREKTPAENSEANSRAHDAGMPRSADTVALQDLSDWVFKPRISHLLKLQRLIRTLQEKTHKVAWTHQYHINSNPKKSTNISLTNSIQHTHSLSSASTIRFFPDFNSMVVFFATAFDNKATPQPIGINVYQWSKPRHREDLPWRSSGPVRWAVGQVSIPI